MTGRLFRGPVSWDDYTDALDLRPPPGVAPPPPQFNIAPNTLVPVIRPREHGAPGLEVMLKLWGLIPAWWNKPLSEKKWTSHTARCEEIDESAAFRGAFRYRRCLVPVSGFYLWSGEPGRKVAFSIGVRDAPWFCLAGVWERWGYDGAEYDTFAVLSTEANALVSAHSSRMPVIIRPGAYKRWLDVSQRSVERMFEPLPAEDMIEWPAGEGVGNMRNQHMDVMGKRPKD